RHRRSARRRGRGRSGRGAGRRRRGGGVRSPRTAARGEDDGAGDGRSSSAQGQSRSQLHVEHLLAVHPVGGRQREIRAPTSGRLRDPWHAVGCPFAQSPGVSRTYNKRWKASLASTSSPTTLSWPVSEPETVVPPLPSSTASSGGCTDWPSPSSVTELLPRTSPRRR